jgi:hypothetical protein
VFWASPKHEYAQEHFMKRKGLLLLVLAALVAGGAFAQKVGDTVDFYGQKYDVKEMKDGRVVLQLTPTLDGTWKTERGTIITINGNTAVYKQLSPNPTGIEKSARDKGFVKIGSQTYRNLKKTGDLTWTGQIAGYKFYTKTPDICEVIEWIPLTLTLSTDGKTFVESGSNTIFTRQ